MSAVFIIICLILGIITAVGDANKEKENINLNKDFYKFVAYHEAAHAVIGVYNGMRCLEVMLNTSTKNELIDIRISAQGYAIIELGVFAKDLEIIKVSTMININLYELPKNADTINFAKRYLQMMYAGDIALHILFNIKIENLWLNKKTKLVQGEDKQIIETVHNYLEKVGQPISVNEVIDDVKKIFIENKEIKAAIHFLADTMLKNPGVRIPESHILYDLKLSNFFDSYLKKDNV